MFRNLDKPQAATAAADEPMTAEDTESDRNSLMQTDTSMTGATSLP